MSRSIRKGPHIDVKLLKKVDKMNESTKKTVIKTWARNSVIVRILLDTLLLSIMEINLFLYLLRRIWLVISLENFLRLEHLECIQEIERKNNYGYYFKV